MLLRALEIVFVVLAGAFAARQLTRTIRVWRRLRGARLVTCTATGYPATVRIDVLDAALTTLDAANPKVRIADCSRWAICGTCDQGCRFEAVAEESALRSVVDHWYAQKKCVYCGKLIGTAQASGHHAALLTLQGVTHEWTEVPADRVMDSLGTDRPVCWNCHVAETFRRQYPDMVTDRPWPRNADRRAG